MIVLVALYGAVLDEVVKTLTDEDIALMRADYANLMAQDPADLRALTSVGTEFFFRLVSLSNNPALVRGIQSVIHIVKLGGIHLFDLLGAEALGGSQQIMLDAVAQRNTAAAHRALAMLAQALLPPEDMYPSI